MESSFMISNIYLSIYLSRHIYEPLAQIATKHDNIKVCKDCSCFTKRFELDGGLLHSSCHACKNVGLVLGLRCGVNVHEV